jgi:hypothetical protein
MGPNFSPFFLRLDYDVWKKKREKKIYIFVLKKEIERGDFLEPLTAPTLPLSGVYGERERERDRHTHTHTEREREREREREGFCFTMVFI